ncbi:MAG TPA: hypothetical protein VL651_13290 [Bacteroidia bacterium]|jgi:hypothetical protein|nr:hypothetical protein [Bacteroidia bacterium]
MKHFLCPLVVIFLAGSCRYSIPLIKIKKTTSVSLDSGTISNQWQFYYPSLTAHGLFGYCSVHIYHGNNYRIDSSCVMKMNTLIIPGSPRTFIRKKAYDTSGNLVREVSTIEVVRKNTDGHFKIITREKNADGKWIKTITRGATKPRFIYRIVS